MSNYLTLWKRDAATHTVIPHTRFFIYFFLLFIYQIFIFITLFGVEARHFSNLCNTNKPHRASISKLIQFKVIYLRRQVEEEQKRRKKSVTLKKD